MSPSVPVRELLQLFAVFIGVGENLIDMFAEEHPELFDAPPESPAGDLDPAVRDEIDDRDL